MNEEQTVQPEAPEEAARRLPPEARRALAEAQERRRRPPEQPAPAARELGGRGGLDPARYGDWETRGIASDF
jgi:hypothetical protein